MKYLQLYMFKLNVHTKVLSQAIFYYNKFKKDCIISILNKFSNIFTKNIIFNVAKLTKKNLKIQCSEISSKKSKYIKICKKNI